MPSMKLQWMSFCSCSFEKCVTHASHKLSVILVVEKGSLSWFIIIPIKLCSIYNPLCTGTLSNQAFCSLLMWRFHLGKAETKQTTKQTTNNKRNKWAPNNGWRRRKMDEAIAGTDRLPVRRDSGSSAPWRTSCCRKKGWGTEWAIVSP